MGVLFTVIKITQEKVRSIKRILRRNFRTMDTGIALLLMFLVSLAFLVFYVISGLISLFVTYIIPPSSNIVSILSFLIVRYIFPAAIFVVVKLVTKLFIKKLSGFWVIRRRKIYMGINLREVRKIRQIRKPLRDRNSTDKEKREAQLKTKKYFVAGIVELLNSSKIKPCEIYSTETHEDVLSLPKKRISANIVILCKNKTKKKYLTTEYIMLWGIKKWLRLYFGNSEEPNEDIYKQFYLVQFRKIPEKSPDCNFECCANYMSSPR